MKPTPREHRFFELDKFKFEVPEADMRRRAQLHPVPKAISLLRKIKGLQKKTIITVNRSKKKPRPKKFDRGSLPQKPLRLNIGDTGIDGYSSSAFGSV